MLPVHHIPRRVPKYSHVSFKLCFDFVKHHHVDDLHQLYIKQVPASHGYLNRFRLFCNGYRSIAARGRTACDALILILEHPQDFSNKGNHNES
jgi:hypothetical protein